MKSLLFRNLICRFKGHEMEPAGSCPFTELTYSYCKKCDTLTGRRQPKEV